MNVWVYRWVYRQPGCLRDQYGGQTHRHPPREGQLDLYEILSYPADARLTPHIPTSFWQFLPFAGILTRTLSCISIWITRLQNFLVLMKTTLNEVRYPISQLGNDHLYFLNKLNIIILSKETIVLKIYLSVSSFALFYETSFSFFQKMK